MFTYIIFFPHFAILAAIVKFRIESKKWLGTNKFVHTKSHRK